MNNQNARRKGTEEIQIINDFLRREGGGLAQLNVNYGVNVGFIPKNDNAPLSLCYIHNGRNPEEKELPRSFIHNHYEILIMGRELSQDRVMEWYNVCDTIHDELFDAYNDPQVNLPEFTVSVNSLDKSSGVNAILQGKSPYIATLSISTRR